MQKKKVTAPCLLACVIVNYKTPELVIACLPGLLADLDGRDARVVIVDNCSGDDSARRIREWVREAGEDRRVQVLESSFNGGFAAGNNLGIRAVQARYYLLLNSDTLVRPGAIAALLEAAESHPEAGLISPRLEWPDGTGQESCFRLHSPLSELSAAAQTGVVDALLHCYAVPLPVQETVAFPEWTSFACVLVRGEVFEQVGLLDDGYFMYFEDVEFCHRAALAGWRIVHDPRARVVHLRGGSSSVKEQTRQKKRVPRYYYESRARYFYQVYGRHGLWAANLLWWVGRGVSKTRQLLGRTDKSAVQGAWLDIWINCKNPLKPYTHPSARV